ncbi:OsmC family protein, partial [Microbacterium sp.]|uniref:OsmC family protein n=1 Tax=Microbacterium sp. TaxID=51671 RepID=UPI002C7F196D
MQHSYEAQVEWTGNRGEGTRHYRSYDRTWNLAAPGKPVVACSNDPLLGGDPTKYNPEDLLLSAVSACHMLWYLHLASRAGLTVHEYVDRPVGLGESTADGVGRFERVILRPTITLEPGSDVARADAIHAEIHRYCFIGRSVAFPIEYEAQYRELTSTGGTEAPLVEEANR